MWVILSRRFMYSRLTVHEPLNVLTVLWPSYGTQSVTLQPYNRNDRHNITFSIQALLLQAQLALPP